MKSNRELRAQRADTLRQAKALSDKGKLNPADQVRFTALMSEAAELKEQYESIESRGAPPNGRPNGDQRETSREVEHREAFVNYLRLGPNKMPTEQRDLLQAEYRDMGSGGQGAYPGATAGFFVPVGFTDKIISALKYTGPLVNADLVEMLDTETGQMLPYPTDNDTTVSGARIGEGQQVQTADVELGQIMLGAWKYSSQLVKVSIELLQDSAFDFETYLVNKFALRLGRILNSDLTNGTGSGQQMPLGIVYSTSQNGTIVTAIGSAGNDGVGVASSIGSDDLINLEHSVDPLYRPNASYMMNDSVYAAIRRVKDKYGRPLWEPSLIPGGPDRINGYNIYLNAYMSSLQTGPSSPPVTVNSVLFGNLKRFLVRRVKSLTIIRLEERFADRQGDPGIFSNPVFA